MEVKFLCWFLPLLLSQESTAYSELILATTVPTASQNDRVCVSPPIPYTVDIQLPPHDRVQVVEGNSTSIIHRIYFNESESDLFLYLGFDSFVYSFDGEYLGGNLRIDYSIVCDILSCLGPTPLRLGGGEAERCQTIEVTVQGHRDVNGSNIMFKLYDDRDRLFRPEVIRMIGVDVKGKWKALAIANSGFSVLTWAQEKRHSRSLYEATHSNQDS